MEKVGTKQEHRSNLVAREKGSALITILFALAVLGAVGLVVTNSWSSGSQQITMLNQRVAAVSLKSNIEAYFKDATSWAKMKQTTNANGTSCLSPTPSSCGSISPQQIKMIFDGAQKPIYWTSGVGNISAILNSNGVGQGVGNGNGGGGGGGNSYSNGCRNNSGAIDPCGFTFSGETCGPTATADSSCPFRVEATWEPYECASGTLAAPCTPTRIKIVGKIVLKDTSVVQQKADNYTFTVIRAP